MNGTQSRDLKMQTSIKVHNARMALQKSVVEKDITKYQLISLAGSKEKNRISSAVHDVFIQGWLYTLCEKPAPLPSWHIWAYAPLPKWLSRSKSQNTDNYEVKIVPSINMHDDDTSTSHKHCSVW